MHEQHNLTESAKNSKQMIPDISIESSSTSHKKEKRQIQEERRKTFISFTSGWYRIPPFIGPRALSCWTLNPTKDAKEPSSFGIVHSTYRIAQENKHSVISVTKKMEFRAYRIHKKCMGSVPYFDLPKRNQKTLLELSVETKDSRCLAKVSASSNQRVHLCRLIKR